MSTGMIIFDSAIALAYYPIPIVLVVFVTRRADVVFVWVFCAFRRDRTGCSSRRWAFP
jgi:hypothetical protein